MNLDDLVRSLAAQSGAWAYLALFLGTFIEGFFPPLPSDVIVLFCTLLVAQRHLYWLSVLALSFAGAMAGTLLVYWFGARHGRGWVLAKHRPFLPPRRFLAMESHFGKYGNLILALNRVVVGGRSVGFLVAGLSHYPLRKVLAYGAPGTFAWYVLLMALGLAFGERAGHLVQAIIYGAMALVVLSVVSLAVTRKLMA
ncbi:MAG TPA: DedA family protein [Candidatus Edwardsbacteria bacterium]|nr:DedA family protein [Candidatus Edwardsbacteria bacterium]